MKGKQLEKELKAMANRRRLAILKLLKNEAQVPVKAISEEIKLSFKATSKHLSVLYAADLVDRQQVSRNVFYSLSKNLTPGIRQIVSII